MSADASVVVWSGLHLDAIQGDGNNKIYIFAWVREADAIEQISVAAGGGDVNGSSFKPRVSADGRYVVFESHASNLVADDTNHQGDIFRYDRVTHSTIRVSVGDDEAQGTGGDANHPDVSADGNLVVFSAGMPGLVAGDDNGMIDVFLRNISAGTTVRLAQPVGGANGPSFHCRISSDGSVVVFESVATNLVPNDANEESDLFALVVATGAIDRVSAAADGGDALCPFEMLQTGLAAVSADGRYVSFASNASNLIENDTNVVTDVFVRDRVAGTTERVSVTNQGAEISGSEGSDASAISADGRFVVFNSGSNDLIAGDTQYPDVFVRDRLAGITERVSLATSGDPANGNSGGFTAISSDGRFVLFSSEATNLDAADALLQGTPTDLYLRDRGDEIASEELTASGSLTTDAESDGSTASDPVETTVVAGTSGSFGIAESIHTAAAPPGQYWITREIEITTPATSDSAPHTVTFVVDASHLPIGFGLGDLKVYKDGSAVSENPGATTASPDPCITARTILGNGDLRIVCLFTTGGTWDIGDPTYFFNGWVGWENFPAVNEAHAGSVLHIKFSLGGDQGLGIFGSTPEGVAYPISGEIDPDYPLLMVGGDHAEGQGAQPLKYIQGLYVYDWQTSPSWRGTWRQFTIGLKNGITRRINIHFR